MLKPALLPDRHPERDFFIADIFDSIPVKDDLNTMEYPFFSVDTKPRVKGLNYHKNGVSVELSPHYKLGLPTIHDKDILLYCGSLVMAEINKGKTPPKTIRFSAHDLLVTTNRQTNGQAYSLLRNAFDRLAGCLITTNIKTTDLEMSAGFHILDRYMVVKDSRDRSRMVEIEVTLSDWLYRAFLKKEVLSINRNYFRLRKPIERRIYEIARKHCGRQDYWEIKLDNLQDKIGSASTLRKFRYQLKQIIEADNQQDYFPDYDFTLNERDIVTFTHKPDGTIKQMRHENMAIPSHFDKNELTYELSSKIQSKVMAMAKEANLDFWNIVDEFFYYIGQKGQPKNINGAFLNFAKKKIQKHV